MSFSFLDIKIIEEKQEVYQQLSDQFTSQNDNTGFFPRYRS